MRGLMRLLAQRLAGHGAAALDCITDLNKSYFELAIVDWGDGFDIRERDEARESADVL
ncbi:MAG: hypothetical protein ACLPX9_12235 [Rhodomicrobium sp.]